MVYIGNMKTFVFVFRDIRNEKFYALALLKKGKLY